jgi:FixJ family two-component response regulator
VDLKVRILSYVLEDDRDTLEAIDHVLKSNGIVDYGLYTSPDEMMQNIQSDIVICVLDYYLNGVLNGLDLLKEIKRRNSNSYVIVMSGQNDCKVVIDLLNAGANKYIDKNNRHYLNQLVEFMQEGLTEAKKRWELVDFLETQMINRKFASGNDKRAV